MTDETPTEITTPESAEAIDGAEVAYAPGEPVQGYEDLEVLAARKEQQEQNQRKVQLLERVGVNVAPALLGCRLETLIEWAVGGEDTQQRKDFDAEFEEKLEPLLDHIAQQVKIQMAQRDVEAGARLLNSDGSPAKRPPLGLV